MKYSPFIIVVLLLFSSIAAIGISKEADDNVLSVKTDCQEIYFNQQLINSEIYQTIKADNSFGILYHANKPILPRKIQTFELPFGTKIKEISVLTKEVETIQLTYTILPAPNPIIQGLNEPLTYEMDPTIYGSNELFPNAWYSISTGGGLNREKEHTTFITIESYPVRYNPIKNNILWARDLTIELILEQPENPLLTAVAEFDLVVISPEMFSSTLQPLINHKNSVGVKTYLKTTEEIYNEYTGVDKPEEIKYYIKDAIETNGIDYVLLVGGLKSIINALPRDDKNKGDKDWLLPVRYTNNKEMGGTFDPGFISDLYYADIYDSEGHFETWDKDEDGVSDGIFARWSMFSGGKDVLDLYPDVYVGRLACRNNYEVQFMVDKIITYETETFGSEWFDRIIGVGGDSHEDSATNYIEGEVVCDYIFDEYMSDFTPVKLYASYKDSNPSFIPSDTNMIREISEGAGFLLFDGHGSPGSWNTHWPGEFNWDDTPGGISCYDFPKLKNSGKYPICVIGGCHNSQFNVSLIFTALNKPFSWAHGIPYAECFAWHLARKMDGGSIASFGNTGLGYGTVGNHGDLDGDGIDNPDTVEALGGYQEVAFFKTYNDGVDILGDVWAGAERMYLNTYPGMDDQTDCKTVTQWPILGDPTLKIGGYQ